jgi:uncharacterized protein YbcI
MLIIVMRGGLTTAEQTMLDFGHPDLVRQFRQLFENEMTAGSATWSSGSPAARSRRTSRR